MGIVVRLTPFVVAFLRDRKRWIVLGRAVPRSEAHHVRRVERLVLTLAGLGPTFIKLGQVLSTRPDVIPSAYVEAFQTLQDEVHPLPLKDIERHMIAELGAEWRSRLSSFDDTPLATASIAQVHRAVIDGGAGANQRALRDGVRVRQRARGGAPGHLPRARRRGRVVFVAAADRTDDGRVRVVQA